jgi:MFS family permease
MMESVATEYRAEGFTVSMYSIALGGGIGGLVGGLIFEHLNEMPSDGLSWDPELLYLSAAHLLSLLVWVLSRNLTGVREQLSAWDVLRGRLIPRQRLD